MHILTKHAILVAERPLYGIRITSRTTLPECISVTVLRRMIGQVSAQNSTCIVDYHIMINTHKLENGDSLYYFPKAQPRIDALSFDLSDIAGAIAIMHAYSTGEHVAKMPPMPQIQQ
jgi:hypothetical protein